MGFLGMKRRKKKISLVAVLNCNDSITQYAVHLDKCYVQLPSHAYCT